MNGTLGMASGRVSPETPLSQLVENGFGDNGTGELPVQRNKTLKTRSGMNFSSEGGQQGVRSAIKRRADLRRAAAAILEKEASDVPHLIEVGAVDDRAAVTLRLDQPGSGQDAEMARHGVVRHGELPRDFSGWQTGGLVPDEHPEHLEAGVLG